MLHRTWLSYALAVNDASVHTGVFFMNGPLNGTADAARRPPR